ncbi:Yhc1 protein [Saccharomycopsis crataegensis]|uniref:Yhc1 protein n=1 Tax=Saccharomycopsis crataegensis TaxID=43959 RepID=A0AAV5QHN9_9ASCO|nr:Yhc1 protein [Saccharomycopsis crataegensis]
MPKYYCDYCKSYLTHDSTSVRKSHLIGKNHIKYVCDYYEREAINLGIWNFEDDVKIITMDDVYGIGAPGAFVPSSYNGENNEPEETEYHGRHQQKKNEVKPNYNDEKTQESLPKDIYTLGDSFSLSIPLSLPSMPNPPPSVFRYSNNYTDKTLMPLKSTSGYMTPDHVAKMGQINNKGSQGNDGDFSAATSSTSGQNKFTPKQYGHGYNNYNKYGGVQKFNANHNNKFRNNYGVGGRSFTQNSFNKGGYNNNNNFNKNNNNFNNNNNNFNNNFNADHTNNINSHNNDASSNNNFNGGGFNQGGYQRKNFNKRDFSNNRQNYAGRGGHNNYRR